MVDAPFDAGAVDLLLAGALLFVDAGLAGDDLVFMDLGFADAGFVPTTDLLDVTFALEVAFLGAVLALAATGFALVLGLDVDVAFFFGGALSARTMSFGATTNDGTANKHTLAAAGLAFALVVVAVFEGLVDVDGASGFFAVVTFFLVAVAPAF